MEKEEIRFEEAMQSLEEIVGKLESGEVPLEEAITLYKKGMELSSYCHSKLQDAEKQLISIIDRDGNEQAFDPTKGGDSNA
jgi:exodeoxyribonuclease VII small subunit